MQELSYKDYSPVDGLFLERFEAFMDKCLMELQAFSEREERSYEEMRIRAAEWHSKYLFSPKVSASATTSTTTVAIHTPNFDRTTETRNILIQVSRALESLGETCGIQSFFLAVDLHDITNEGFLGGTVEGREFWRGLRSGGEHGATTFKQHCIKQLQASATNPVEPEASMPPPPEQGTAKQPSAKSVKLELYESIRKSLRSVSGIRNAEMKWTQPERLCIYGVCLVGWPPDIPAQNPSSLNSNQNKRLLELFQNGTLKFVKTFVTPAMDIGTDTNSIAGQPPVEEEQDVFTWINMDGIPARDADCESSETRPVKRLRAQE
ncbi:hypothetical protein VNI00_005106 [Paramarasmius palmivorus]|uniref:Uncharacterized protein n=1 Tax=Paramarasmius palmivorus TaxID=297713 RepID=A0AAW0DIT9_9AGAR